LAEETIKEFHMRAKTYQKRDDKRYNNWIKVRNFQASDLVWRKCGKSRKDAKEGKLAANWKGPFKFVKALRNVAY